MQSVRGSSSSRQLRTCYALGCKSPILPGTAAVCRAQTDTAVATARPRYLQSLQMLGGHCDLPSAAVPVERQKSEVSQPGATK